MNNLKKIVRTDAAFDILDNSSCAGSDWGAGGCAILAQALNKLEGYPMVVIYNTKFKGAEHFGVKTPSGKILDHDGEHPSEDAWLKFFKENEIPREGDLVVIPFGQGVEMDGIKFDDKASEELAKLIQKYKMIRENIREVISESEDVWYHGTPDVREIEKEGGFTQRFINIEYVEDIDEWNKAQEELEAAQEVGDGDRYFEIIDEIGNLRKSAKIRKPVFLSNVYSVAKTYSTDKPVFDYQNAEEKVLKVKTKGGKGVKINAPGQRFRFINIEPVRRGFISAGVDPDNLDAIIAQLNFAQGTKSGIRTDDIAAIGDWLGFDYIDVVGVLDSYHGGSTKSTVRMVFDPSHIEIMRNESLFEYIETIKKTLSESDEPSPTFEWDIAKEKIDSDKKGLRTKEQAYNYFSKLLDKVKSLPKFIKTKITKYAAISLVMLLGAGTINGLVSEKVPEISYEIANIIEEPEEVEEVVEENPRTSSDSLVNFLKYEEGSSKNKGEPVLKAYKIGDGMVTVGWGHAERVGQSELRKGDVISYEQAEKYLAEDIAEAEKYLNNILDKWEADSVDVKLDQGKYDAMVSMIFNMGIGNFRKTDFIQLVKQGKHDEAAEKILTTAITYPGHVPRRQKESEMFSGEDNTMLAMKEVRKIVRQVLRESVMHEATETSFIAYHGTDHEISKFDTNFLTGDRTTQHHGAGIYFATNEDNARMFGDNVYKVRISGKFIDTDNPVSDVDPDELAALMKLSDEEWELEAQNYSPDPEIGLTIAVEDAMDYAENEADAFMRVQSGGWYMYDRLGYVKAMTKLGYAGMIVDPPRDWVNEKHIIVFNPDAVEIIEKVS